MNFSKEMIEKAKAASSAEELLEMAAKEGIELSAAEAETYFSFLKDNGPLSDEDLSQIAGGKGKPKPKFAVGQTVEQEWDATAQTRKGTITGIGWYCETHRWSYNVHYYQETQKRLSGEPPIIRSISVDRNDYLETMSYCKVYW